jgi:hypothetical protein
VREAYVFSLAVCQAATVSYVADTLRDVMN